MKTSQIIGVFLIGFLCGAGLLYVVLPDNGTASHDNENKPFISQNQTQKNINIAGSENEKVKQIKTDPKNTSLKPKTDTIIQIVVNDTAELEVDSSSQMLEFQDSTYMDSSINSVEDQEIKVKKEQFLLALTYPLIIEDSGHQESRTDSLLASNLGVNKIEKKSIAVEFWKSPLSSKGYFYNNHKVKLYGMDPQLKYSFYKIENQIYLKSPVDFYLLKPSNEFQKFIFADEALIQN